MNADTRTQYLLRLLAHLAQRAVIRKGERNRLDRPLEKNQESIGLVYLATATSMQQIPRIAIVTTDQVGGRRIAHSFDQSRRIGDIADQQRAHTRRLRAGRSWRSGRVYGIAFVGHMIPLPSPDQSDLAITTHCPLVGARLHFLAHDRYAALRLS
jgi:hypothetical protein